VTHDAIRVLQKVDLYMNIITDCRKNLFNGPLQKRISALDASSSQQ